MRTLKLLLTAILISALSTFSLSTKAQTGYYSPSLANFDSAMTNLLNTYDIPGGQLAITYQGRLVYSRGFGLADTATNTAVCPDHIFRIASLSKQITAITSMHLYEQGRIGLNDTVFGPNGILNDPIYQTILDPLVYGITVKHLLSHQGGWDRAISGDPMTNTYSIALTMAVPPPAPIETIIQYILSQQMLDFAPGTSAAYSNLGFNILGKIIEKITNQNYETYVRDTILAPLGITEMHDGRSLLINKFPNEVHYYDDPVAPLVSSIFDNTILVPMQYGGIDMEAKKASGGWVASAQDLCKLMCAVDKFSSRPDFLSQATIDTMVQPTNHYVNGSPYALGWWINSSLNVWYHSGSLTGTMTFQARRNNKINYAILANSDYSIGQYTALSNLVVNVMPTILSWPTLDLFDSTAVCTPTSSIKMLAENPSFITVYPNPTNSQFNFSVPSNVQLTNALGQLVSNQKCVTSIDITGQPAGIYFVIITDDNGKVLQRSKIVKE